MKKGEVELFCGCGGPTEYATASGEKENRHLAPLCWTCATMGEVVTSPIVEVIRCPSEGVARLDRGHASGLCECEECGARYFDHAVNTDHPFLQQLCDGSLVKL